MWMRNDDHKCQPFSNRITPAQNHDKRPWLAWKLVWQINQWITIKVVSAKIRYTKRLWDPRWAWIETIGPKCKEKPLSRLQMNDLGTYLMRKLAHHARPTKTTNYPSLVSGTFTSPASPLGEMSTNRTPSMWTWARHLDSTSVFPLICQMHILSDKSRDWNSTSP